MEKTDSGAGGHEFLPRRACGWAGISSRGRGPHPAGAVLPHRRGQPRFRTGLAEAAQRRVHRGQLDLWLAANVKVYGGGVAEEGFLRALSDLIGDYSYTNVSISSGKSGSSRSRQEGKERIFDVSILAELDRGRADHADHHMSVLLDPRGPFYKCDMQKHRAPNTWSRRRPRRAGFLTCEFSRSRENTST
jgi:TraM recognition site of TraD and TraG